jgi:Winged helix DNA-binding domain
MAVAEIGLRRLASQRVAAGRFVQAADVVRWLGALQAQDYHQSLWAIGSRMQAGTAANVERAIADRQIVRTWLMRGTIHFAPPEDVRWLLALVAPRLAAGVARRRDEIGLAEADVARSAQVLAGALSGDRRLSRPEVMQLLEDNGIATAGGHGYHILWRLAQDGLICLGPMQDRQQTFVLLDDWAPRAQAREPSRTDAVGELAGRFAASRGPVTAHDLARWAGMTVADARRGLADAPGLVRQEIGGAEHFLAAAGADDAPPAAARRRTYLLAGFDEFMLGYKDRDAILEPQHAAKVVPGANGVFRPIIVTGGRIVGTWSRSATARSLRITVQPFAGAGPKLVAQVGPEANRYRTFLGLPASCKPAVSCDEHEAVVRPRRTREARGR